MTVKELKEVLSKYPEDTKVRLCNLFGRKVTYDIDEVMYDKLKKDILVFPELNLD